MKKQLKHFCVVSAMVFTVSFLAITFASIGIAQTSAGPAPPGYFTDKVSGTYYGPGKSSCFTLRIPANKNDSGSWAACEDNGTLPAEYTCNLSGQSPPLEWSGEPKGTKGFAIVVWHKPPDYAEKGAKFYWIMWGIPATTHSLPQNAGVKDSKFGKLGLNEHGTPDFEPSCSHGPGLKTYIYNVYALDAEPQFKNPSEKVTRDVFMAAIKDVTLASAVMRVNTDTGNMKASKAPEPEKK